MISIHAPPRGATRKFWAAVVSFVFQFTPLREGRQEIAEKQDMSAGISIHAPPRGATERNEIKMLLSKHFNSRPSARGDMRRRRSSASVPYFNSRPSARGDQIQKAFRDKHTLISIHAPPRGATRAESHGRDDILFQFTPLREGRRCRREAGIASNLFQFTPLREGRREARSSPVQASHFNSRPSARGDCRVLLGGGVEENISIHAPPRGATLKRCLKMLPGRFQFTPLREGRRAWVFPFWKYPHHFNSRPSARGDQWGC